MESPSHVAQSDLATHKQGTRSFAGIQGPLEKQVDFGTVTSWVINTQSFRISMKRIHVTNPGRPLHVRPMGSGLCLFFMLAGDITAEKEQGKEVLFKEGECNLFPVKRRQKWKAKLSRNIYRVFQVYARPQMLSKIIASTPHLKKCVEYIEAGGTVTDNGEALMISNASRFLIDRIWVPGQFEEGYYDGLCSELLLYYLLQVILPGQPLLEEDLLNLPEKYRLQEMERRANEKNKTGKEVHIFRAQDADIALRLRKHYVSHEQKIEMQDLTLRGELISITKQTHPSRVTKPDTFTLIFMLRAAAPAILSGMGQVELNTGEYSLIYTGAGFVGESFAPGEYRCIHIDIPCKDIRHNSGLPVSDLLKLKDTNNPKIPPKLKFNKMVAGLLDKIMDCRYSAKAASIFLRPVCVELVRHFLLQYEIEKNPRNYSGLAFGEKREVLDFFLREVIRLSDKGLEAEMIAREYKIGLEALNQMFEHNFLVGVSEIIKRTRLERAFRLLMWSDKGQPPDMDKIAHSCGYISTLDFLGEFRTYYQCFPEEVQD